jgi:hypothetical protein
MKQVSKLHLLSDKEAHELLTSLMLLRGNLIPTVSNVEDPENAVGCDIMLQAVSSRFLFPVR